MAPHWSMHRIDAASSLKQGFVSWPRVAGSLGNTIFVFDSVALKFSCWMPDRFSVTCSLRTGHLKSDHLRMSRTSWFASKLVESVEESTDEDEEYFWKAAFLAMKQGARDRIQCTQ